MATISKWTVDQGNEARKLMLSAALSLNRAHRCLLILWRLYCPWCLAGLVLQSAFDRLDLALHAPDPGPELLLADRVQQLGRPSGLS